MQLTFRAFLMQDARRVLLHAGARALPGIRSLGSTRALADRSTRKSHAR